jgi:hypothetical protein
MKPYDVDKPLPYGPHARLEMGAGLSILIEIYDRDTLNVSIMRDDTKVASRLEDKHEWLLAAQTLCRGMSRRNTG